MEKTATAFNMNRSIRRPLLGVTILLVEDSRFCSEAVRMMSIKSGARLRRADCLRSARRHLAIYRPDVLMVDLGLPDGPGVELIREMQLSPDLSSAIIALSGDDGGPARAQALEAGAQCFLTKPLQDLAQFQQVVLSIVQKPGVPHLFVTQGSGPLLKLDKRAFFDDLRRTERLLRRALPKANQRELRYLAQFARSVAQTAQDHELMDCAAAFSARLRGGAKWQHSGARILNLLQNRLKNAKPV